MQNLGIWIIPITFLPGIGLLILSTANRFGQLNTEISHLETNNDASKGFIKRQIKRSHLFSNALVSLYTAVGFFSVASLLSEVFMIFLEAFAPIILITFVLLGVFCVLFAASQLIQESLLALKNVRLRCIKTLEILED